MKLFKLRMGHDEKLSVAESLEDMYERRGEVDATYEYLPVDIEEVTVPGYVITATPSGEGQLELSVDGEGRGRRRKEAATV